ncbi:MAG: hypothetical protein C5B60_03460 [Chloroflexi bacterium]|nr:MAG: hypothetical protein C5B60_03460 [Chloroflexota bacterium]
MLFTHYRSDYVKQYDTLPGMRKFTAYFRLYRRVVPVDRAGTITFPIRTKCLFPLPRMRAFAKTYEALCNERARELLKRAEKLDVPLYVFWSGGVDSTCVLVSLLKNSTSAQKQRIVVLLSEDSITEYPAFYLKYIRGQLPCRSAMLFPYILGSKNLLVSGEHNDQLFGSDVTAEAINRFGAEAIAGAYDPKLFQAFFAEKLSGDEATAGFYVKLFERLKDSAPVPIKTNFDLFWWVNFAVKWQTVYTRMLSFTARRNAKKLSAKYLADYYAPFYCTEGFQLWSMNNLDSRIKDGWRSYKWPAKELIYEFTKDADYRDTKIKRGSLQYLFVQHLQFNLMDDHFKFHDKLGPEIFYEPENDFV